MFSRLDTLRNMLLVALRVDLERCRLSFCAVVVYGSFQGKLFFSFLHAFLIYYSSRYTDSEKPLLYINIVRDPFDRLVSFFYYIVVFQPPFLSVLSLSKPVLVVINVCN